MRYDIIIGAGLLGGGACSRGGGLCLPLQYYHVIIYVALWPFASRQQVHPIGRVIGGAYHVVMLSTGCMSTAKVKNILVYLLNKIRPWYIMSASYVLAIPCVACAIMFQSCIITITFAHTYTFLSTSRRTTIMIVSRQ